MSFSRTMTLKLPNVGINTPKLRITISIMTMNAPKEPDTNEHSLPNRCSALADSGSGAVQPELVRVEQNSPVIGTRVGDQKHYRVNNDSPVFGELCSVIKKTVGLQHPVREALEPFTDKINLALNYGFIAKQSDATASDIDLLLVSDVLTLEEVESALAPAEKLLARSVNPTLYSSKELEHRRKTKNTFLARVLNGPTIVLIGSVDGK